MYSGITQQCCYDNEGSLKPGIGQPNIGTPLYEDMNGLVTHLKETVLLKIYCCIEGNPDPSNGTFCSTYNNYLQANVVENYVQPIPGENKDQIICVRAVVSAHIQAKFPVIIMFELLQAFSMVILTL